MKHNGLLHGLIGALILGCLVLSPFVPMLASVPVAGALLVPDATFDA